MSLDCDGNMQTPERRAQTPKNQTHNLLAGRQHCAPMLVVTKHGANILTTFFYLCLQLHSLMNKLNEGCLGITQAGCLRLWGHFYAAAVGRAVAGGIIFSSYLSVHT